MKFSEFAQQKINKKYFNYADFMADLDIIYKEYQETQNNFLSKFNNEELRNVLRKVKQVKIKPNFKEILILENGIENYQDAVSNDFFEKYANKETNVYKWCGDWWICEDDNYVITQDCFDLIENKND